MCPWDDFLCGFGSDVLFTIDHLNSISFFSQNAHQDWLTKEYITNWFLVLYCLCHGYCFLVFIFTLPTFNVQNVLFCVIQIYWWDEWLLLASRCRIGFLFMFSFLFVCFCLFFVIVFVFCFLFFCFVCLSVLPC